MITSVQNSKIKKVKQLLASKNTRLKSNLCVIEGIRLAEEAMAAGWQPEIVLFSSYISQRGMALIEKIARKHLDIEEVHPDLLNRISDTRQSQGLIMVVPIHVKEFCTHNDRLLVLDNIRDPGNMGAILRSAAALTFNSVIMTPGCADPFSPKVMRAAMGAHFKIELMTMKADEILNFCKDINKPALTTALADPEGGIDSWECDLTQPICLIIGAEAEGAGEDFKSAADIHIRIPMHPTSESFNAAISASILMYETIRQRKSQ